VRTQGDASKGEIRVVRVNHDSEEPRFLWKRQWRNPGFQLTRLTWLKNEYFPSRKLVNIPASLEAHDFTAGRE
jgi:hypothetical protein